MRKKILVLASTFPRWKGDTNPPFVFELSRRLADIFDITVLTPHFPGSKNFEIMDKLKVHRFHYFFVKYERLAGDGGMLPTLKANKWYYLTVPFFLLFEIIATLKLVKKLKPDIIHAHWIIPQGLAAYINFLINKTPYVITSHGGDIFGLQNKYLIKLKKLVLQKAKSITVVSSAIKKEVIKIDPSLEPKIEIIPMGVDSKLFNPDKYDESIKKKYGITGPFLLFVGRLAEKKGVRYLIEAMPAVLNKFPKSKLLIIGSGPLELDLKNLADKLHLSSSINFIGAIQNSDLPKFYATADIFIGPSIVADDGDREGLPVTYMEAMACGCPVIATNLHGNRDIINERNGYLVRQKDNKDIADKITSGLKNKWKRNMIDDFIKRNYSWKVIVNKYLHELS
jgi:glycosyltransferase involved in cell wall biosynthesis